ncbi:MAG: hypothetical protein LBV71_17230 [Prevotella sp.]|jgi:hypothetical protein|nr:hypothetical protein [Prevotella sp.]
MKRLILFFLIGLSLSAYSQGYYNAGEQRYVYADIANVRQYPTLDSEVVDKLKAGQEINIEDVGGADKVGEDKGFWINITYKIGDKVKSGFLWSNVLSYTQMRRGDTKFVYGKESGANEGKVKFQVKAIRNDSIIDRKSFDVSTGSLSFTEGKIIPDGSLKNVNYIVQLYFTGEACGYGNYHFHFGWSGNRFLELPYTVSVGDGGVYSYGEYLIYPTDSQLPEDTLLKVIAEGEAPDENSDIEFQYKTMMYKWDGEKITPITINK